MVETSEVAMDRGAFFKISVTTVAATAGGQALKLRPRRFLHLATGAAMLTVAFGVLLSVEGAWSQTRTVKVVVPFPPGGTADTVARLLADQISGVQGLTILVENRAGAASVIGTEAVSRALRRADRREFGMAMCC